jgi:hypothetical protein
MKKFCVFTITIICLMILTYAPACKKTSSQPTLDELEQEQAEAEKQAEEEAAKQTETKPPPPPRMNDDVYVEITARSALIRDKYKDDPNEAEKEIEAFYEKFGVTFKDYKAFQDKLGPQESAALAKKISDFITRIAQEYR